MRRLLKSTAAPFWIVLAWFALMAAIAITLPNPPVRAAQASPAGEPIRCVVAVSTATTLTAVGGSCAAPGPQQSIYITDILFSASASGVAADSFNTLKFGTGGTCGTGTGVFWGAFTAAAAQETVIDDMNTPIRLPANNEICWINSTAGSKFIVINGYIAP